MWKVEELFFSGDAFFENVLAEIQQARRTVKVEVYMYEPGELADRFTEALCASAHRGVQTELIVDGVGSPQFSRVYGDRLLAAGVQCRIYHPLPWDPWAGRALQRPWVVRTLYLISRLNRRNHRKLFLIDRKIAFVGSQNISDWHLESVKGRAAWRDTGVRIEGRPMVWLIAAFQIVWDGFSRSKRWRGLVRLGRKNSRKGHSSVEVNQPWPRRKKNVRRLTHHIRHARARAWITTPYFAPSRDLIRALIFAAGRGIDVALLLPAHSDVVFMPWVAREFYVKLLKKGVRIFEYQPSVLHAKTVLIDDWARVGSSNLNHRSWIHDLELNVILEKKLSLDQLEASFKMDLAVSQELTLGTLRDAPFLARIAGRIFFLFRYFL